MTSVRVRSWRRLAGLAAALDCADAGADVTLYEAPHTARRRDLLVRAQRPLARQRPARRAPLLHRLPRRSCAGSAAPTCSRYQSRLRVPVLREGRRPAFISPHRPAGAAPPRLDARCATRRSARSSALAAVRAALALRRLDPADPALDRQTFGVWLASHGQSAERDRVALEPDRPPDAQPPRRARPRSRRR